MSKNRCSQPSSPYQAELLERQLASRGKNVFYPCIQVMGINRCTPRAKSHFPRYLLALMDSEKIGKSTFRYLPGAAGLIMFGGEAAHVPDGLNQAIRHVPMRATTTQSRPATPAVRSFSQSGPSTGPEAVLEIRIEGTPRIYVPL